MGTIKVATWNIGKIYQHRDYIGLIVNRILLNKIDLICFQEYLTDSALFENTLIDRTGLKYFNKIELSESHIVKNHKMGLSVLSKYPISHLSTLYSEPNVILMHKSNRLENLHSKGFAAYTVSIENKKVTLINGHWFPFHRYIDINININQLFATLEEWIINNTIAIPSFVCGDFNTEEIEKLMPRFSLLFYSKTAGPTHDGKVFDYIYTNKEYCHFYTQNSESDHTLCVGIFPI